MRRPMADRQVAPPNLKPIGACGCGCGVEGTLRARPWRDGTRCVKSGCRCNHCRGRANRSMGAKRQARAAQGLGMPVSSLRPGHEEHMAGAVRIEVKGGAQARPVWTRFLASEAQSEAQRPRGDHRPFVACFESDGTTEGLVVIRRSKLAETVAALASQLFEETP